jgi:peptidoglycan LD-endopeptidase LytH
MFIAGCGSSTSLKTKLPDLATTIPEIEDAHDYGFEPSLSLRNKETREWDGVRYMPVKGITQKQIANNFGAPRDGGKRSHKGIDIFAPSGRELLAVTSGWIERTYNNLGGHSVWLRGDDGVSYYYAHLLKYASNALDGDRVAAGEVIGYVGNSGNAKNTPAHLHIEMRQNGATLNPYYVLKSADLVVVPVDAANPREPQYADRTPTGASREAVRTMPARRTPGESARTSGGTVKGPSTTKASRAQTAKLTKKQKAAKLAAAKKAAKAKKYAAKKKPSKRQYAKKGRGKYRYASR